MKKFFKFILIILFFLSVLIIANYARAEIKADTIIIEEVTAKKAI